MANADEGNGANWMTEQARRAAIAKLMETQQGRDMFNQSELDWRARDTRAEALRAAQQATLDDVKHSDGSWNFMSAIGALLGGAGALSGAGAGAAAGTGAGTVGTGAVGAGVGEAATGGLLGSAGIGTGASAAGAGGLLGSAAIPTVTIGAPAGWAAGGLTAGQIGTGAAALGGAASIAGSGGAATTAPSGTPDPAKEPGKSAYDQVKGGLQTANNTKNIINGISSMTGQNGGNMATGGTTTTTNSLDPRIAAMLFGEGGNQGLLGQFQQIGQQPQSAGSAAFGNAAQGWLQNSGNDILKNLYGGANGLLGSAISAPQAQAAQSQAATGQAMLGSAAQGTAALGGPAAQAGSVTPQFVPGTQTSWNTGETLKAPTNVQGAQVGMPQGYNASMASASQVQAPAQNNINLTDSYNHFVSGNSGVNSYLNSALQAGTDLTNAQFGKTVNNMTDTLQRSVLPGIRSNSVLAGQYGGSRQGIAEGLALSDYTKQLTDASTQLALGNSANTTAQQANSYNQGQDRALSATQGLGAQQYGVASQNSAQQQQANLANAGASNAASQTNYQGLLSGALANAGYQQQANLNNYAGQQAANSQSSSQLQQANLANQSANQSTQQFNSGLTAQVGRDNAQLAQNNNQFNAGLQQQSNLTNLGNQQQFNLANLGNQQQMNLANMGAQNQFGSQNLGNQQQTGLANQSSQNQTSLANLQSQLGTNSLNSANQATGMQGMSGLLGQLYGFGQNQDNYAINRAQQMNGLLAPYLSANSGTTTQSPTYSNTAGNILGGAAAGLGLYNQFANLGGGSAQDIRNGAFSSGDFFKNLTGSFSQPGAMTNFNVSPGTAPGFDLSSIFNFGG